MLPTLITSKPSPPCATVLSKPSPSSLEKAVRLPTAISSKHLHSLDLLLPNELWKNVSDRITEAVALSYRKVEMTLLNIVTGPFFQQNVVNGDVLMVSDGKAPFENCFGLRSGVLTLELDRHTYERCGLQGDLIRGHGRVHQHQRYRITVKLQVPSMVPGKKAHGRLIYAVSKVLVDKLTWLYIDLQQNGDQAHPMDSVEPFSISKRPLDLQTIIRKDVYIPSIFSSKTDDIASLNDADTQCELLEYIGLLLINSPQTFTANETDPALCLYARPGLGPGDPVEDSQRYTVAHVRCRGLFSSNLVRKVLGIVRQTGVSKSGEQLEWWMSRLATFDGNVFVAAQMGGGHCLEWQVD